MTESQKIQAANEILKLIYSDNIPSISDENKLSIIASVLTDAISYEPKTKRLGLSYQNDESYHHIRSINFHSNFLLLEPDYIREYTKFILSNPTQIHLFAEVIIRYNNRIILKIYNDNPNDCVLVVNLDDVLNVKIKNIIDSQI